MKILADASLPLVSELFASSFHITLYNTECELPALLPANDILLCRSTLKVNAQLLAGSNLKCIATASSGIDHIDSAYLKKNGIHLFDAKGCNAQAVADYVVATLAFLYRNALVKGNKAGIIGVGEVGSRVEARLQAAGFDVMCYDPLRAMRDNHYSYCSLEELATCDLLSIHANLHDTPPYSSINLLTTDFFSRLKSGVIIINAARGGILNEEALLNTSKSIVYCTDVYSGEPAINPAVVDFATLCTPHIAGHSIEAKNSAVLKLSQKLHQHYGLYMPSAIFAPNINSVSLPPMQTPLSPWQDRALSLYNPMEDTQILKAASDKKQAFLTQRQAHQHRHNFASFKESQLDKQTQLLMGYYENSF